MTEPILRRLRVDDSQDVLAAFLSNDDMIHQGNITTPAKAETYAARLTSSDSKMVAWALEFAGHVIGLIGVTLDDSARSGWFWYWMHNDYRGRGWTARAAATVANWALTDLGLDRLELGHRSDNPASGAVARAAGFVQEEVKPGKFLINGERIDVIMYARLAADPFPRCDELAGVVSKAEKTGTTRTEYNDD